MRPAGGLKIAVTGIFCFILVGCDTSFLTPRQSPPPPPAGSQAQPPAAPASQLKALEDKVHQLEGRVAALEQSAGKSKAAPAAGTTKPGEKCPPPAAPPSADRIYSDGLRLYQAKKYPAAREKFTEYLKSHPRGPKAAEARYYLGESFYQEKRYGEAREEFNKVVLQYPDSILAPTALLRQAYSYQQLNLKTNFTDSLKKLIQQYPQSPEAQEARKLLKQGETPR
jgi:tol-pal system protein YbgF